MSPAEDGAESYLLWAGGIFDASALHGRAAVTPSARRWQKGLVSGIVRAGWPVYTVGHVPEPLWPRGPVRAGGAPLEPGIEGSTVSYWNLPMARGRSLSRQYRRAYGAIRAERGRPAAVLAYNAYPQNIALGRAARADGVPWVPIVADVPQTERGRSRHDRAIESASGRVFLSWSMYEACEGAPALHLDGGIDGSRAAEPGGVDGAVVAYTGALNQWGGVSRLVEAFRGLDADAELWICGKGADRALEEAAAADRRIRLLGFVDERRLESVCRRATVFVNPRPSDRIENHANFPSKVLEYLSWGTPVVSTWTGGLSPEYRDVLVVVEDDTAAGLASAILGVLAWSAERRRSYRERAAAFVEGRSWDVQAARLVRWLDREVLGHPAAPGARGGSG